MYHNIKESIEIPLPHAEQRKIELMTLEVDCSLRSEIEFLCFHLNE